MSDDNKCTCCLKKIEERKIKKKLKAKQLWNDTKKNKTKCEICDSVYINSPTGQRQHINSKKHKTFLKFYKKLKKLENPTDVTLTKYELLDDNLNIQLLNNNLELKKNKKNTYHIELTTPEPDELKKNNNENKLKENKIIKEELPINKNEEKYNKTIEEPVINNTIIKNNLNIIQEQKYINKELKKELINYFTIKNNSNIIKKQNEIINNEIIKNNLEIIEEQEEPLKDNKIIEKNNKITNVNNKIIETQEEQLKDYKITNKDELENNNNTNEELTNNTIENVKLNNNNDKKDNVIIKDSENKILNDNILKNDCNKKINENKILNDNKKKLKDNKKKLKKSNNKKDTLLKNVINQKLKMQIFTKHPEMMMDTKKSNSIKQLLDYFYKLILQKKKFTFNRNIEILIQLEIFFNSDKTKTVKNKEDFNLIFNQLKQLLK